MHKVKTASPNLRVQFQQELIENALDAAFDYGYVMARADWPGEGVKADRIERAFGEEAEKLYRSLNLNVKDVHRVMKWLKTVAR